MPVHIDELHTEIEARGGAETPTDPATRDPRWTQADRARKQRRDDRWRSERTRAEGLDD
ncbi:hypothetical protein [Nannocystis sp.]|uniref:hypothetical protein n=1 Tax=Nannocystis sp. TaxID=1962667 RepID=UPI002427D306|nr:hypothetical protein [Nannocystis sp.]MBK7823662.1 hypothetical protein [Nannocystis sp.]MBK9755826.1 hypothetical protein [Nannocystis sp.]